MKRHSPRRPAGSLGSTGVRAVHRSGQSRLVSPRSTQSVRAGLTLFEVIISLAIFMASIAAIGQLISTGVRAAVQARLQSQAVLRAESKMAEVVAGLVTLQGSASGAYPDDPTWTWSIATAAGPHANLYLVEVTAMHDAKTSAGRQSYSLRRLVRDPQMALDAYEEEQEAAAAVNSGATAGSTSSSGKSSSGTSSGGKK